MAIYVDKNRKIKNIFVDVNGEKKSISSVWVNSGGVPTKVFQTGHKHIWEENIEVISWTVNTGFAYSVTNNKYKLNSYYTSNPWVRWEITVPDTAEFDITYDNWTGGKLTVQLDDEEILNHGYIIKTNTIILTPGTHTLYAVWEKVSGNSATITLNEVKYSNHICSDCKESELHSYKEFITKNPTCTEIGEKTFTCTKCGHSYTEEIPADGGPHIDENGDDICDKCGHKHTWEENIDTISWVKNFTQSTSLEQNENKWKLNSSSGNQYNTFTAHGTWDIEIPLSTEYLFDYDSAFMSTDDRVRVYLDDNLIVDFSNSSKSGSEKILLTTGKHTLQMYLNKNNKISSSTYATITLNPIEILNHICTECDEREVHHYTEGIIIKEPTCTENGEKEFICTKCGYSHIEEIGATGHNYVDGVCDKCGSLNLVSKPFWSASASTSRTKDSGGGHYDKTDLAGIYSPNIEITEDMVDGEYLLLDFYVGIPFYGGQGHYGEVDGINGLSMLQKYDEGTDTWETVYSYGLSYNTIGTNMSSQEGGYSAGSSGDGIRRTFQLEKGIYRIYGRFSAARSCNSSVVHYYYSYNIKADLCQIEK